MDFVLDREWVLTADGDALVMFDIQRCQSFRRVSVSILFSHLYFFLFFVFFEGAHGVGRRHIKNTLIAKHPDRFAYPIPRKDVLYWKPSQHQKTVTTKAHQIWMLNQTWQTRSNRNVQFINHIQLCDLQSFLSPMSVQTQLGLLRRTRRMERTTTLCLMTRWCRTSATMTTWSTAATRTPCTEPGWRL